MARSSLLSWISFYYFVLAVLVVPIICQNIPNVNILNTQYNVDYGNTVTLECTVTANPGHTSVYWQKIKNGVTSTIDASTVASDARLSGSAVNTPSLTITNVNLNDIASYICFAQNSVGIGQSAQTSLVVSGGIPNVVILRNSYGVQVGSVVTLQCVVSADPAHTMVKWERFVNGQLQDVTNVGAVGSGSRLTGSQVDTPSLTINQVTFQDEGNYICTATNAIGTGRSQQTHLGVSGTVPVVTVPNSEYQGNFGQTATIVCTVTANPTHTRVYWKKLENGVLSDVDMTSSKFSGSSVGQPSLTVSSLNKNDEAFYKCYAENTVGTGKSQQTFLRVIGDIPTVQITSRSYSVILGQNAVLGCTVTANPTEVSVFWRKYNSQNQLVDIDMTTNNNNKYQGSVVGTSSLTIIGTTSDDTGRYVCYAVNAVGTGSSGITTLNIDGAIPIVNIPQDTYSVNIGNQVTLACTVSATPGENNVYWNKKNGNGAETTITKSDATKYQGQTVQSPGLIILNTDFNDIATYICYATNAVGTGKSNPTNLQVIGSLPNVQIPQPSYSVNYDQTATIPCNVIATPGITNVQWIKVVNGVEQNIDMTQAKYSGATTNNPALNIANANLNDEAVYICTATNSVGTGRSQWSYLDVVGAIPVVTVGSNSYSVVKNQNIDLVCTIVATPAATNVQWYRNVNGVQTGLRNVVGKYNTPTVNSPNLRIFNAGDQDRGYYVCTASNIVGTGTSQTTFLDVTGNIPIVTVAPLIYNGNIGGSVTLGCQVVANPAATSVYWIKSKNSQDITISSTTSKYSFSTNNPSLTINSLSSDDDATYVCYATNSIGTGNSQAASLNVIGSIPQVTIPEQSYSSNIGSSVTLVCTVVANPTHNSVYWRRIETNGQVTDIAIDNSKYQGATVGNPSLTITNVQLADRLNYICFATNSVGTGQSSQTYLNVIGNPPVPTIGSISYSVPFGGSVEMVCTISSNPAHSVVFWKRIKNGVETLIDASYIANNQNKYGGGSLGTPSLTVKSADRNADQAFYECSATNAIGTGTSSRTFLTVTGDIPNVNIPENYYAVEISNNVVIPCNINSNPSHFAVTWQRRDNNGAISNLDVSDQTQYNNGNIGTPALTILNAQNADEGYYICTATNAVGTGSSSLTYIDVTGSILQVTVPQSSYNVNYGQTVQLVCTVTGTPAANDLYWIKIRNGVSTTIRQSTMDTNKYSGVSLGNPSLTIINANEADSAVYKCYGTNLIGTAESQQTQLSVIGNKRPLATDILKNLTTVDINGDNIKTVIETVKNVTSDPGILTSIDVIAIADVLFHIPNDTLINQTVVVDILDIINNVLNVDPDKLKKSQNDGSATNRLLEVLDIISLTLHLDNQSSMQFLRENILMNVFDITSMSSPVIGIQIEAGKAQSLTTSNIHNLIADTNITVGKIDAAIILPVELINNINNSTRVTLSIYRNWNLFSVRSDIREYLPNSRVVSASVSVDGIPIYSLGQYRVQALLFSRMESENNECGYWNYDLHDKSGGWATSGCHLNRTEYGRHICVCDHLTNFAVLVNIGGQDTLVDTLAINIISWIGLILSIAGLSLTILSFFLFKHLRKGTPQQTLFNLALSMLCFLIVFIVGIEQTHDFYGCIVVAALLHYFILVAFMWMLIEGILQYRGLVKVLGTYVPRFILKTAVPAWGVPLIPVVIVGSIDHELYHGGKKACWMSLTAFYYAFAIPVGIIILANAIIFGMILKNILGRPKGLQSNQSERKRAMMNLRAAFSVFVLLGLTWIFGLFTIEEASIVFQYIFTILNVFQGFLIFVLFTARRKQVRQNWKKLCCKEKPRDKYIKSESSSEMNKMKIRSNVNNSGSDTREVLT